MTFLMVCICHEEAMFKFGWNLLSLKAPRMVSKMDDIAGGLEDAGRSWLGLVSLIMIGICPWRSLESLFQFVWSSVDINLRSVSLKVCRGLSQAARRLLLLQVSRRFNSEKEEHRTIDHIAGYLLALMECSPHLNVKIRVALPSSQIFQVSPCFYFPYCKVVPELKTWT